jgi:putative transposase
VRTFFFQADRETTRARLRAVVAGFEDRFPKAAALLAKAEYDVTAYAAFPRAPLAQALVHQPAIG